MSVVQETDLDRLIKAALEVVAAWDAGALIPDRGGFDALDRLERAVEAVIAEDARP